MFEDIGIQPRVEGREVLGWTKKVTPERYLKMWPNGPEAKLALQLTKGPAVPVEGGKVKFFSPRSKGLQIVVDPVIWAKVETPGGSQVMQTQGARAEFDLGIFETDDPKMIAYLTEIYSDRRYPVVRTDMKTKSAH